MQTHCPLGPASYGKGRVEEEIKKEPKKSQSGPSGLETMIATDSKLQKQRILFQLLKIVNYNMPLTFDTMHFLSSIVLLSECGWACGVSRMASGVILISTFQHRISDKRS